MLSSMGLSPNREFSIFACLVRTNARTFAWTLKSRSSYEQFSRYAMVNKSPTTVAQMSLFFGLWLNPYGFKDILVHGPWRYILRHPRQWTAMLGGASCRCWLFLLIVQQVVANLSFPNLRVFFEHVFQWHFRTATEKTRLNCTRTFITQSTKISNYSVTPLLTRTVLFDAGWRNYDGIYIVSAHPFYRVKCDDISNCTIGW